jgi:hypothetical protein
MPMWPHHVTVGEYSDITRDRDHICMCLLHYTVITEATVNLWLCLVCKLNFVLGIMHRKKQYVQVFGAVHSFRSAWGSWDICFKG